MWTVVLCVVAVVVVKLSHWYYKWSNPKCNGKLPPGSMGFPIIGETIDFFKPCGFYEVQPFIKKRMARYGSLFRTNIFGSNAIVSTDPEVNFEILKQENKSFVLSLPNAFLEMFGKNNKFMKQGNLHKYVKQLSLQLLGSENLKRRIIREMDRTTRDHLKLKATEGAFEVKDAASSVILGYMLRVTISDITPETERKLIENYQSFSLDLFTSPFKISSWTALFNGVVGRKRSIKMIKEMFTRRKESKEHFGDFMDYVMGRLKKDEGIIDEDEAIALTSDLLLLSQESSTTAIAFSVKFIAENPRAQMELKREHDAIVRNRTDKESGVTWEEYRSMMTFTHMVINESLRLGTTAPVLFRKAVCDVEVKGFTIPKGWNMLAVSSVTHYNGEIYDNPNEFNPWRWEGKELLSGSKTFMAFGGGARLCSGAEFSRLQMAMFLHHLVTKYKVSLVEGGDIVRAPLIRFSKGVYVKLSEW